MKKFMNKLIYKKQIRYWILLTVLSVNGNAFGQTFRLADDNIQVVTCLSSTMLDVLKNDILDIPVSSIDTLMIVSPSAVGADAYVDWMSKKIVYSYKNGFFGLDSIRYRVTSGSHTGEAWVKIRVAPCPDNIDTAFCVGTRDTYEWAIIESFRSRDTNLITYMAPLVADLDGDGIPEILAARMESDNKIDKRYFKGIYVYWGNDRENPTLIPTVQGNFVDFGFSAAKIKINGQYKSIVVMRESSSGSLLAYDGGDKLKHCSPKTSSSAIDNRESSARIWKSDKQINEHQQRNRYAISFVDFDNDGEVEIYVGNQIFDASSGKLLIEGPANGNKASLPFFIDGNKFNNYFPAVADVDGDGKPEYIAGTEVYKINIVDRDDYTKNEMKLYRRLPPVDLENGDFIKDGYTVTADINKDGRLDVIVISNFQKYAALMAWDVQTGALIGKAVCPALSASFVGVPFIGNVDNNSDLEILFIIGNNSQTNNINSFILGYRLGRGQNFDMVYRVQTTDRSGFTGITLFDFNNDGSDELVYRDETDLRIMHAVPSEIPGGIGTFVNLRTFPCGSGTGSEYPLIADIDNDGSAEIITIGGRVVIPSYISNGSLRIYKSGNQYAWASARKVWNQYAYNVVNINEDLTVPQYRMGQEIIFPNGRQPYNNFLQQQTLLNKIGDPLRIMPNVKWVEEPKLVYNGRSLIYTGSITNIGNATLRTPFYITVYKDDTLLSNIIAIDSVKRDLMPYDSMSFSYTIPDISRHLPIDKIIISVNDRGTGQYPYQAECEVSNRKEVTSLYARDDTAVVSNCGLPVIIDVLANDNLDSCTAGNITFAIIKQPKHARAIQGLNSEYKLEYLVDSGYTGYDSIRYTIFCPNSLPNAAWVYIEVKDCGQVLRGTVFPFVHEKIRDGVPDSNFNKLFPVTAKLYAVPPVAANDPLDEILLGTPLYMDTAVYYDGRIFVPGTPRNPGRMGVTNNPGLPIRWSRIGKTQGTIDTISVTENETPLAPVGIYTFTDVPEGDYILVLSRAGYMTRFGKITVEKVEGKSLGHRELIPGDMNGDFVIDAFDISSINAKISSIKNPGYNPRYDINADRTIDANDILLIKFYMSFTMDMYEETMDWLLKY